MSEAQAVLAGSSNPSARLGRARCAEKAVCDNFPVVFFIQSDDNKVSPGYYRRSIVSPKSEKCNPSLGEVLQNDEN